MAYYYPSPPGQAPMAMPPGQVPMPMPMPMAAPAPPPMYAPPPQHRYTVWFMPAVVGLKLYFFIYSMYVNDCPSHRGVNSDPCILQRLLRRCSFQPIHENRLLGPTTDTLIRLGALRADLVYDGDFYRLFRYMFFHRGLISLIVNMTGVLTAGNHFEAEFGFWTVGPLYLISGIGGALLSVVQLVDKRAQENITVGSLGCLFGLLGANLSELMTNWSHHHNDKGLQIFWTLMVLGVSLAIAVLNPRVDWATPVGGFVTGYLLGLILFIKPQPGYVNRKYLPPGYQPMSRHKAYQYILLILALLAFIALFVFLGTELEAKVDKVKH